MASHKIHTLDDLAGHLPALRAAGKKVVHCHGVFDLLHIGHIRYLQRASQLGDVLVVTVTPDKYVNKGPHRPAFAEQLRMDAVAALECVDYLALNQWPTAIEALGMLRPDVYVKGAEFRDHKTPELLREESAAAEMNIAVAYVDEVTSSSSHLINQYLPPFSEEVEQYLGQLRQTVTSGDLLSPIQRARTLKVLVIGEAIVEEYYYCAALGQSAKAPIVAARYESHERFAGGALAVANHLAGFCDQVHLLTLVGDSPSEEPWIRARLRDNIVPAYVSKRDAPTIVKRRYRESYFDIPLFAVHSLNDRPLNDQEESSLLDQLDSLEDYDIVAVADYGHTMLGEKIVEAICSKARLLAVTTQASADNLGFHTISKYRQANFVSLTQRDLELECRQRSDLHRDMLRDVAGALGAKRVIVTLGKRGCLCYGSQSGYHEAPGLATRVVDRIGASDAFFAVSTMCAALDVPNQVLAFLGNVAGAEAVSYVGYSQTLERESFCRHVESLLK